MLSQLGFSQQLSDTTIQLNSVQINTYFPRLFKSSAAYKNLDSQALKRQGIRSNLRSFNFIPGVQMEERSPASLRLSIRGSLLRSPFGIRNVKIYLDEFPLTDASGNTYLNLLDPAFLREVIILKGPQASHLGTNTGGSILINPTSISINSLKDTLSSTFRPTIELGLEGASFGEVHEYLSIKTQRKYWLNHFFQSRQKAEGYRDHSAMQRLFLNWQSSYAYSKQATIKFYSFLSRLKYQTPGGLTFSQMRQNRRSARPATTFLPGAEDQNAGIENNSLFLGIHHQFAWRSNIHWNLASSYLNTDFSNPFITNYETRNENNINIRTYLKHFKNFEKIEQQIYLGWEWANATSNILNTENNRGVRGSILAQDQISIQSSFAFIRGNWNLNDRVNFETGLSLNWYQTQIHPQDQSLNSKIDLIKQKAIWAPKIALSYSISTNHVLFSSLNKGFSSSSLAEVRPSNMQINKSLQAEKAWNKEIGYRWISLKNQREFSINYYHQELKSAIVRRLDEQEQEYFINAGSVLQSGIEITLKTPIYANSQAKFLKSITWESSYQYQNFSFQDYQVLNQSYKGNKLTGSPEHKWNQNLNIQIQQNISLHLLAYQQSRVPLNDANTVFAEKYNVFDAKINWLVNPIKEIKCKFYVGINNIFNADYSLGPDLNAIGSRFYNPAPLRNHYLGIRLHY